jgi:hypothetical protein
MQHKITVSVCMTPNLHRRLKRLSADRGRPIGDCIAALVDFNDLARQIGDNEKRDFVNSVLDALFTPVKTAWEGEELSESPPSMRRVRFAGDDLDELMSA